MTAIEKFFTGELVSSEGQRYRFAVSLRRLGPLEENPSVRFLTGECRRNYACADLGGPRIIADDYDALFRHAPSIAHKFGHVLGFHHWPNSSRNIMSWHDYPTGISVENLELLWGRYNLD